MDMINLALDRRSVEDVNRGNGVSWRMDKQGKDEVGEKIMMNGRKDELRARKRKAQRTNGRGQAEETDKTK